MNKILPDVQQALEYLHWDCNVRERTWPELWKEPDTRLNSLHNRILDCANSLPFTEDFDPNCYTPISSFAVSGAMQTYDTLFDEDASSEESQVPPELIAAYSELQHRHGREESVRGFIRVVLPNLADQFDGTLKIVTSALADNKSISSAALAIRTLLDKTKGELFAKARQENPRENMTWELMSERLCTGAGAGMQSEAILSQQAPRKKIYDRLSQFAKERTQTTLAGLRVTWVESLDHLFVVLKSVSEAAHGGTDS